MGSVKSPPKPSLIIKDCKKIDPAELAEFVIKKSRMNKEKYCDYDESVEDPPPDLSSPSTASG
jgi:hypothetical protein